MTLVIDSDFFMSLNLVRAAATNIAIDREQIQYYKLRIILY